MVANHPTLTACLEAADSMESALNCLGDTSNWPADHELRQQCSRFRQACRELAQQKGIDEFAVAFIGPKNAGKTTILSLLIRSRTIREKLAAGQGLAGSTKRILWLSSRPITTLDRRMEESLHLDPSDLVNLGCDYTLVDVPGANEANRQRSEAAQRALCAAHLKILVVEARTMEDATLLDYLQDADGATILPLINQIRPGTEDREVSAFMSTLRKALPGSNVLTPLCIGDFHLAGDGDSTRAQEEAADQLQGRLQEVIGRGPLHELLEPQFNQLKARFQDEMHASLTKALPATAEAARELQEFESGLALQALERLLGADDRDRAALPALKQQIRALYQQRTPGIFFPWRTFVSLANLLYGALEKVPLLLLGSLPSLLSSAMTAVKNVAREREYSEDRKEGLRKHAELLVKESLYPRVDHLEAAIRSDLRNPSPATPHEGLEIEFEGLEILQTRSSELFQEVLETRSPGRVSTWITGLLGMGIFWGIFIWPFIALYTDYYHAVDAFVRERVVRERAAPEVFPSDSLSMVGTSFLLAIFPMLFWLLLVLGWAASTNRALGSLQSLRQGHQKIIEDLKAHHLLRIRARHPHLQACLRLFSKH